MSSNNPIGLFYSCIFFYLSFPDSYIRYPSFLSFIWQSTGFIYWLDFLVEKCLQETYTFASLQTSFLKLNRLVFGYRSNPSWTHKELDIFVFIWFPWFLPVNSRSLTLLDLFRILLFLFSWFIQLFHQWLFYRSGS